MESDGFLVTFQYFDHDLGCLADFTAICQSVPRIGEGVIGPKDSGGAMVVKSVGYRFQKAPEEEFFVQSIYVLLEIVTEDHAQAED